MKFSEGAYITIMTQLGLSLDIAKKEGNKKKQNKLEEAMQEVEAISTY
jgi:hypothetical protein